MIKISIDALRKVSAKRPKGYYDEVVQAGKIDGDVLILEESVYRALRNKFSPAPKPIPVEPIPRSDWPLWAKALALLSKPDDKGVGDVVARVIGDEKSEAFKKWYKKTFGKDCGCSGRQLALNLKYPFQ